MLRILHESVDPLAGLEICSRSGVGVAWLYPILQELEDQGRIKAEWDDGPYPRRRLYSLPH